MEKFSTLILAAGKGTRMKSDLAKVLHPINDRPMVHYVIDLAKKLDSEKTVLVVGHQKDTVKQACANMTVEFVDQDQQLGTGHAVQMAHRLFHDYEGSLLVLSGDVPLLTEQTLNNLIQAHINQSAIATLLTANLDDPSGYGRVIRAADGTVSRIVEHKDANADELRIKEINVGIYIFKARDLFETLALVKNDNAQGEYYLPDVVKIYVDRGEKVVAQLADNFDETRGINNVQQLKEAETIINSRG